MACLSSSSTANGKQTNTCQPSWQGEETFGCRNSLNFGERVVIRTFFINTSHSHGSTRCSLLTQHWWAHYLPQLTRLPRRRTTAYSPRHATYRFFLSLLLHCHSGIHYNDTSGTTPCPHHNTLVWTRTRPCEHHACISYLPCYGCYSYMAFVTTHYRYDCGLYTFTPRHRLPYLLPHSSPICHRHRRTC